jgi:gas vesicle protein
MAHPKLIDVEGTDLVFSSEERLFADWIRLIDRWIGDANHHYQEHLGRLRSKQKQQEEHDREEQRRVQDATEKLKRL